MRESAIEIACNLPARYLSIFDQIVHDGTVPTLLLSLILWANIAFCNKQKHTLESDHGSVLSSYLGIDDDKRNGRWCVPRCGSC